MARPLNRLTEAHVRRAKPGWHADGGGLYLRVESNGRWWCYRYGSQGKKYHGLGPASIVSLAQARDKAQQCRALRLEGEDPIAAGKARRAAVKLAEANNKTFGECAEAYHTAHCASWTNRKHAKEWLASMQAHVLSAIGGTPVADIDTAAVLRALETPWRDIPETASRLRSRIEQVLDWARVHGYRDGENPARWRGHLDHLLPNRKKRERVKHHPALPYRDVPAFMRRLREQTEIEAPALEYIILTCARASEATGADWREIIEERDGWAWVVPAERIKGRREHRVPLAKAARAILERVPREQRHGRIFPGVSGHMVWKFLRELVSTATVHGMRSSFRDWAAEQTNFAREAAEIALAHRVGDDTEEAYRRGDLIRKRRALAEAWARYCASVPAQPADVTPIRA